MPQANASATATATAIYDHSQSMGMSMDMSFGGGDPVTARWLQSAGLQHLAATSASSSASASSSSIDQQQQQQQHQHHRLLPNLFPQGYGVQPFDDKQKLFKMLKSMNLGMDSGSDSFTTTAPSSTEAFFSSELRGEFAAGLLDLHSMDDTELLNDHPVAEPFETSPFFPAGDRGFGNESDPDLVIGNQQKVPADNMYRAPVPEREISGKESNLAKIKVVVRKRPLNKKELARKEEDIITVNDNNWLTVHEPKLKVDLTAYVEKHDFGFDAILDHHVSNDEVYRVTVEPIVPTIFQRTKATCFAYGQTGSGKTYTMQPLPLRACEDILKLMNQPYYQGQGFRLWLSFFEIYGGKLYDLLSDRKKLCMREDGRQQVCIVGLREFEVSDIQSVKEYIEKGSGTRSIGSTGANEESSRSHAILQLTIKKHSEGKDTKTGKTVGKLSFIDLAGSERGADTTDNDRQTRMEGAEINKSLLALKECIRALDNDQLHIPFRGSKLTEVLRDSFVGNSRTVMISCISPNSGSCEHTLNTLRYADRVKGLSKNSNLRKDQTVSGVAQLPKDSMSTSLSLPPGESKDVSDYNQSVVHAEASRRSTELQQYGNFSEDLDRNSSSLPPGMSSVVKEENGYAGYTDNRSNTRENTIGSASQRPSSNASNSFDTYVEEKAQKASITSRKISREDKPEKQPKWGLREDKPDPYTLRRQQQQAKDISTTDYDHDINAILQEEEALIAAHRKEIEDTMELVREEMQLLTDVEQPGSLIDDYVSKLSIVLSHKAAGLVSLQAQLARFQKRLKQHEISSLRKTTSSK